MGWLKELREKMGYSQVQIATLCGITQAAYSRVESGARKPSIKLAKKLGKVLDVEWTKFFD